VTPPKEEMSMKMENRPLLRSCNFITTGIAKGTNATRWQQAADIDQLPPCNNTSPAGLNIQAWVALAQAARYEEAWRK
jgi:hypothetical protein